MISVPPAARGLTVTAFAVAQRFIGIREVPGSANNPAVLAMLRLDESWPEADEVPWCSAFANYVAWILDLPRSKSLRARSWLAVGQVVVQPRVGFDVVILNRAGGSQDPDVLEAPGHVGFYAGEEADKIAVLGGNQGDAVTVARFPRSQLLGIRRLWP